MSYCEEFTTPLAAAYSSTSPASPDFDHRLEAGAHELDYEMKSFYATQQLYAHGIAGQAGEGAPAEFGDDLEKLGLQKNGLAMAVPGVCEDDDMARSSGDSDQDRDDSESGRVILLFFLLLYTLMLKTSSRIISLYSKRIEFPRFFL